MEREEIAEPFGSSLSSSEPLCRSSCSYTWLTLGIYFGWSDLPSFIHPANLLFDVSSKIILINNNGYNKNYDNNNNDDDDDDEWNYINDDDDDQSGFIHSTSTSIQNINFSLCERAKAKLTLLVKAEHDVNLKKKKQQQQQQKKHGAKVKYVHVQERKNQCK